MNKAQGAGATAEAEEITTTTTKEESAPSAPPSKERLKSLLTEMGLPNEIIEEQVPPPTAAEAEAEAAAAAKREEEEAEAEAAAKREEEEAEAAARREEEGDHDAPQDWPEDAKAQVLDARKKKRQWRDRALETEEKAKALEAELAQVRANPPRATPATFEEPLPDVWDPKGLAAAEDQWERARDWAEDHPNGAEEGDLDPDGKPLAQAMTPQEVRKFGRTADKIVRKAIPQRKSFLEKAASFTNEAMQLYPDLFKDTEDSAEAAEILRVYPEIKRHPDFLLAIGDAIAGRKLRLAKSKGKARTANGDRPLSEAARKVVEAPRFTPAPSASRGRSMERSERGNTREVDVNEAEKQAIAAGADDRALEALVTTLRRSSQAADERGGRKLTLA